MATNSLHCWPGPGWLLPWPWQSPSLPDGLDNDVYLDAMRVATRFQLAASLLAASLSPKGRQKEILENPAHGLPRDGSGV